MTDRLARALDDLRRKWVPDRRLGVFDVIASGGRLVGRTTSREALADLRQVGAQSDLAVDVSLLPDASVDEGGMAVVTAAVAPLLDEPSISAPRATEGLHGEPLALLERRGDWLHVRGVDGYVAWTHAGYATIGTDDVIVIELDESHQELKGKLRLIPLHVVLAVDVMEHVPGDAPKVEKHGTMYG